MAEAQEKKQKKKKDSIVQQRPYRRISTLLPASVLQFFEKMLMHAGIREEVETWVGKRLLLGLAISIALLLAYLVIYNPVASIESGVIAIALLVIGMMPLFIIIYLRLYFRIADRTNAMERVLPDFLLLTASNMRAGMSPFAAFISAARPEFGDLYEEVNLSSGKASGTASLAESLQVVQTHFDSPVLKRAIMLFVKGIRSGGHLVRLLNSSADEIRRIQDLRAELTTATRSYTIFLGFIVVLVMPFLLSVSTHFLTVFLTIQPKNNLDINVSGNLPAFSGNVLITPEQMFYASICILILTSFTMSCLIGIIGRGKLLYGIKYFPVFAFGSIGFYLLAKIAIGALLSGFGTT